MPGTAQEAEREVMHLKERMLAIASAIFTLISIYTAMLQPTALSLLHKLAVHPLDKIFRAALLAPLLLSLALTLLLVISMRFKLQYFTSEQAESQARRFRDRHYRLFLMLSLGCLLTTIVIVTVVAAALVLHG
jgi:hypothetical protein